MKKKKWMIAAIFFAAMVSSSMFSISANAIAFPLLTEVPDGYEMFEDGGSLDFVSENGYYPVYRSVSDANHVLVLTNYRCNIVELEVPTTPEDMASKYEEIKEKYADVVNTFDQYYQHLSNGVLHITMCDTVDENGNLIKDPSVIKSKRGEMQKLCQELLETGAVTSASYTAHNAVQKQGDYLDYLWMKGFSKAEYKDLTTFVAQQFGEEITVRWQEGQEDYCYVEGFQNVDDLFETSVVLEKQFEGTKALPVAVFQEDEQTYTTQTINLLTATDACGDVDNDGTVSVEDAVSVLTYYAQQSAGLEAKLTQAVDTEESAFLAADVDGDGQITVEDAVAILTYYAQKSAGLDAAW